MKNFSIVVAMDEKNGIGKNGDLAWALPADLKHFKEITTQTNDSAKKNAVVMGRKTWDSLPEKFKPLPGRVNVVLSRNLSVQIHLPLVYSDLDRALMELSLRNDINNIFVIGGAQIYSYAMLSPACQSLYVTEVKGDFGCDTFFPPIPPASFKIKEESAWLSEGQIQYRFCEYRKSS